MSLIESSAVSLYADRYPYLITQGQVPTPSDHSIEMKWIEQANSPVPFHDVSADFHPCPYSTTMLHDSRKSTDRIYVIRRTPVTNWFFVCGFDAGTPATQGIHDAIAESSFDAARAILVWQSKLLLVDNAEPCNLERIDDWIRRCLSAFSRNIDPMCANMYF